VLSLALDTSSPSGSLAVLRCETVIGVVSTSTAEVYSSRMFRELEFLLGELSLRIEQFELFSVAAGPGSFTGLRVGLTAVKAWAEVFGKPIAAVSALEAVAIQARSRADVVIPALDARRGQVYFGIYRRVAGGAENQLALDGEEYVMTPGEFFEAVRSRVGSAEFAIVTPTPDVFSAPDVASKTKAFAGRIEGASAVLAPMIGLLGLQRLRRGELADPLTLEANYVRRTDAELHWKDS
jgi:tRNA threonylcarbamoyladenosine biosynthesis protein TsaB